jgi:DNA-binding transcriptional LysR family regulator
MHSVNWDGLQVFLAVARTGRMSTAARRLDVEHTTISRRLASLEAELGVPLFYRTASGYVLTPHGHNVLSSAEAMEGAAIAVAARAQEKTAAIAGRVRLALPPEFASHWSPNLETFRRNPHIELHPVGNASATSPRARRSGPHHRVSRLIATRIAQRPPRSMRRNR